MDRTETMQTDPTTGGRKGSKLARFSLIPPDFLWALAEHYGKGARKYEDRNWQRGYNWSLSLDALERHLTLWKGGETHDPETDTHHLVCVAWHAIALWWFQQWRVGTNDVTNPQVPSMRCSYTEDAAYGQCLQALGHTGPHIVGPHIVSNVVADHGEQ